MNTNSEKEAKRIIDFLKKTFQMQKITKAVIGVSGGIDSTTSLYLLSQALPKEHIFPIHLYYFEPNQKEIEEIVQSAGIPLNNLQSVSVKNSVDEVAKELQITNNQSPTNQVRLGNIMARMRMIFLYDFAKKETALVVGTENKSEHYLAYFTRFGDEASDIEPIRHLYKTQVYELAKYLNVPQFVIEKKPSANLWEGQTDEDQFGFSYKEADQVLYLHFDKKQTVEQIEQQGFPNVRKILDWVKRNSFKHHVPYIL